MSLKHFLGPIDSLYEDGIFCTGHVDLNRIFDCIHDIFKKVHCSISPMSIPLKEFKIFICTILKFIPLHIITREIMQCPHLGQLDFSVPQKPKVQNSKSYPPELLNWVKWFPKSPKT